MMGTVSISIDPELVWGVGEHGILDKISDGRTTETRHLSRLLLVCEDHDVPITFDVVEHFFHERCTGSHGGPHEGGWWGVDPGTSVHEGPRCSTGPT